jgi:hypothetical protein
MEKAHIEQVVSMVAEPNSQYGAEVFEEYEKAIEAPEIDLGANLSARKNAGKSR